MRKKVLNELEWEEMTGLYEKNNWLRDQIMKYSIDLRDSQRDDICAYLRSNKHIDFEIGGIADYISTDTQHASEFIDLVETMFNDGVINLPYSHELSNLSLSFCDARYFFQTAHRLATECAEYEREGCNTNPDNEFYESAYEEANEKLVIFLSAINKEILERCNDFCDEMDALETWWYNNGADYATDGRYIFEVAIRQYA